MNPTRFGAKSVGDYEGQAWRFGSLEDQDAYLRSRSNQCYPKAPFVVHFANSDSFFLVAPSVDLMTAVLFRCMCGPAGQIVYESDASEPAPAGLGGRRQESYVPMGQRWGDNWRGTDCCVISNNAWEEVMTRFPQVNPAPIRGAVPEVIRVPGALIRHLMGGTNSQELMNAFRLICSFRKERTSMKIAANMMVRMRPCRILGDFQPPAVGGVTNFNCGENVMIHSWFMGNIVGIPTPTRIAELAPAFCDTMQAPEVGQQALDDDDAWLASFASCDLLRMDSGWFRCESTAFSAALYDKNIRFREFVVTHGRFGRMPANDH